MKPTFKSFLDSQASCPFTCGFWNPFLPSFSHHSLQIPNVFCESQMLKDGYFKFPHFYQKWCRGSQGPSASCECTFIPGARPADNKLFESRNSIFSIFFNISHSAVHLSLSFLSQLIKLLPIIHDPSSDTISCLTSRSLPLPLPLANLQAGLTSFSCLVPHQFIHVTTVALIPLFYIVCANIRLE